MLVGGYAIIRGSLMVRREYLVTVLLIIRLIVQVPTLSFSSDWYGKNELDTQIWRRSSTSIAGTNLLYPYPRH